MRSRSWFVAIDENAFKFSWRRKSELFSYFYTPKNHQRANKIEIFSRTKNLCLISYTILIS